MGVGYLGVSIDPTALILARQIICIALSIPRPLHLHP